MNKYLLAFLILVVAFPKMAMAKVKKVASAPARAAAKATHTGMASWYGKQHEGKRMANGKPFRRMAFTAASKTIKLGTRVIVLNLENMKSVVVEITDRGPYKGNRMMDLSEAAARKLDYIGKGLARIMILPVAEPESSAVAVEI